jgi:hypothetical protein
MRITLLLLALIAIGCSDTPKPVKDEFLTQVLEKNKQLDTRVQALETENRTAYKSLAEYRTSNEQLTKDNETFKAHVAYYKNEIETLNTKYALAVADAVKSETANAKAKSNNTKAKSSISSIKPDAPVAPEQSIADLESRIASLRPEVGSGRSKVASLIRGTIDQQMVPPAGGHIVGGQIYRRVLHCNYSPSNWTGQRDYVHTHDASCYRSELIGPVVKVGDFRSSRDKDDAIRRAKDENLPLEQELASLEKELAESKAQLAKLRSGTK